MDIFANVKLVEIPLFITADQKAWLEKMVRKGKIAVPPGGTLPEGSVISIFMRTLLWNSEEQGQSIDLVPEEVLREVQGEGLVETKTQVSEDQKAWLDKMTASSKVTVSPGDTVISMFVRVLLDNAIEQQKALEQSDLWAEDEDE
jgi:hypothetical protein